MVRDRFWVVAGSIMLFILIIGIVLAFGLGWYAP